MFLSAYHFEGDPTALSAAHERLAATYPPGSPALHVCAAGEHGIVVIDACPTRADFETFSQSPGFRAAVGLPQPRVVPLGEVRSPVVAAEAVTR